MSHIISEMVKKYGGKSFKEKVGHTFIKKRMKKEKAIFGAEHSGHFYYKENFYADSGIITSLIMCEIYSKQEGKFSDMVKEFDVYHKSYEINVKVKNKKSVITKIEQYYNNKSKKIDHFDGLTINFNDWWFSIRESNTEPLLRLNIEAKSKSALVLKKKEVLSLIKEFV